MERQITSTKCGSVECDILAHSEERDHIDTMPVPPPRKRWTVKDLWNNAFPRVDPIEELIYQKEKITS